MSEKKGSHFNRTTSSWTEATHNIVINFRVSELEALCASVLELSMENWDSDGFAVKGPSMGDEAFWIGIGGVTTSKPWCTNCINSPQTAKEDSMTWVRIDFLVCVNVLGVRLVAPLRRRQTRVGTEDAPEVSATLDRRWTKGGDMTSGNESQGWNMGADKSIQVKLKSSVTCLKEEVFVLVESRYVIAGIGER